jgi:hemerythrin-like domain-containing protein
MTTITDALRGEHGVLYRLLDHLETRIAGVTAETARELGALVAAAVEAHAHVEDDLLFVELETVLGKTAGPLVVMRHEHAEIERDLAALASAGDAESARRVAVRLVETARGHFAKEEQVLFPLAEGSLTAARLGELGRAWAERSAVALAR